MNNDELGFKLKTIYLSRLNIIHAQNNAPEMISKIESKIKFKAKNEDMNAKTAVKKMVAPILAYFVLS